MNKWLLFFIDSNSYDYIIFIYINKTKRKQKLNFHISTELLVQIENNPKTNRHEHLIRIRASDKCEIVL